MGAVSFYTEQLLQIEKQSKEPLPASSKEEPSFAPTDILVYFSEAKSALKYEIQFTVVKCIRQGDHLLKM